MDLSLPMLRIAIEDAMLSLAAYSYARTSEEVVKITSLSSMDSDLEAFSHNPTDGSFAALAVQPTALPSI